MSAFRARLADPAPVILDGAMGSAIEAAGVDVHNPLWGSAALLTAEGRAINDLLHADYHAAGAELLIANTHNLSHQHCAEYLAAQPGEDTPEALLGRGQARSGWSEDCAKSSGVAGGRYGLDRLVAAAIESARETGALVAGCLASPDRPYTRRASLTAAEVTARLRGAFEALVRAAPDAIFFEMLTTAADLEGVAALIDDRVPVGVGLVCADGALRSGVPIEDAVSAFADHRVTFFVQCTPYDEVDAALERLLAATDAPVGVYANDGRRFVDGAWEGEGAGPEAYAAAAARWVEMGARIVGGCCGTTPQHIAALRERITRR